MAKAQKKHTVKLAPEQENIAERAMLLKVIIRHWQSKAHDRKVSDEVAKRHNADANMGTYLKRLVTKARLLEITKLTNEIRDLWYTRTLPWLDQGTRILPNALYFETMAELKALIHKREDAVNELALKWDEVVAEAKLRLNGMFNEDDYPSAEAVRRAYRVQIMPMPFPAGSDFRMGILGTDAQVDEKALRAEVDAQVQDALREATRDLWERVYETTNRLADRLSAYLVTSEGKVENPFRDSLIENVQDLVKLLPPLNIANDPILDGLTDKLIAICEHTPDDFRADAKLRKATVREAEKILAQVSNFLG